MKHLFIVSMAVLIAFPFGTNAMSQEAVSLSKIPSYLPGSMLARFKSPFLTEEAERIVKEVIPNGILNSLDGGEGLLFELTFDPSETHEETLDLLKNNEEIDIIEPTPLYTTSINQTPPPNDPLYSQEWHLPAITYSPNQSLPGSVIAIIDTGVAWNHPDLAPNIWNNPNEIPGNGIDDDQNGFIDDTRGWDFVNSPTFAASCWQGEDCVTQDNNPDDRFGHGTHVAGIAAAKSGNGIGIAGICSNCSIMPLRAGLALNIGYSYPVAVLPGSAIAQAITYATQNGADVINMSFNGSYSAVIEALLETAKNQGIFLVGSAGNNNTSSITSSYPAAYASVVGISALDQTNQRASFSNYGAWVDLAAPGVSMLSTLPPNANLGYCQDLNGDGYDLCSGTSMAAPIIAGLAGIAKGINSTFTPNELSTLFQTSYDALSLSEFVGAGKINAQQFLYPLLAGIRPPEALFEEAMNGASAPSGTLTVMGTAQGTGFTNYSLEYGTGLYPSQWTTFHFPTTNQVSQSTLCTWNAPSLGLQSGTYTLRLKIQTGSRIFEDRAIVTY